MSGHKLDIQNFESIFDQICLVKIINYLIRNLYASDIRFLGYPKYLRFLIEYMIQSVRTNK